MVPMRLLLTRPLQESQAFESLLKGLNIEIAIEPMLEVQMNPNFVWSYAEEIQAFLVTSQNVFFHPNIKEVPKHIPLYAVGDKTAERAYQSGFSKVICGHQNARSLETLVLQTAKFNKGSIIYLSGDVIRYDFESSFKEKGFIYERFIIYYVTPVSFLTPEVQADIYNQQFSMICFFSPRTAENFIKILSPYTNYKKILAICISEAVADKLVHTQWRNIRVASTASNDGMLEQIRKGIQEIKHDG